MSNRPIVTGGHGTSDQSLQLSQAASPTSPKEVLLQNASWQLNGMVYCYATCRDVTGDGRGGHNLGGAVMGCVILSEFG